MICYTLWHRGTYRREFCIACNYILDDQRGTVSAPTFHQESIIDDKCSNLRRLCPDMTDTLYAIVLEGQPAMPVDSFAFEWIFSQ